MHDPQDCQYSGYCSLAELLRTRGLLLKRFEKKISRQLPIPLAVVRVERVEQTDLA